MGASNSGIRARRMRRTYVKTTHIAMECSGNREGISRSQERVEEAYQTWIDFTVKKLNGGDECMKPPIYHIYNGI